MYDQSGGRLYSSVGLCRALLHIAHLFQDSKRKVQDQSRIRFSSMQVCTVDSTILDPEFEVKDQQVA